MKVEGVYTQVKLTERFDFGMLFSCKRFQSNAFCALAGFNAESCLLYPCSLFPRASLALYVSLCRRDPPCIDRGLSLGLWLRKEAERESKQVGNVETLRRQ